MYVDGINKILNITLHDEHYNDNLKHKIYKIHAKTTASTTTESLHMSKYSVHALFAFCCHRFSIYYFSTKEKEEKNFNSVRISREKNSTNKFCHLLCGVEKGGSAKLWNYASLEYAMKRHLSDVCVSGWYFYTLFLRFLIFMTSPESKMNRFFSFFVEIECSTRVENVWKGEKIDKKNFVARKVYCFWFYSML